MAGETTRTSGETPEVTGKPAAGAKSEAKQGGTGEGTPKTFTQEEVDKLLKVERARYAGLDTKHSTLTKQLDDLQKQYNEAKSRLDSQEEEQYVRHLEDSGVPKNLVQQFLADKKRVDTEKAALELEKRTITETKEALTKANLARKADALVRQFRLAEIGDTNSPSAEYQEAVTELLNSADEKEMELKAAQMYARRLETQHVTSTKPDPQTGRKPGADLTKLPLTTQLGMLMDEKERAAKK